MQNEMHGSKSATGRTSEGPEPAKGLKKILIVDDDPVSLDLLAEVLRKEGYATSLANSGEAASRLISSEDFPLVLSDVRMQAKSGFDLLREMKAEERAGRRAPSVVVLMTGFGSMDGALDAFKHDAFDYISKPFKIEDLRLLVARAAKQVEFLRRDPKFSVANESAGDAGISPMLARSLTGRSPQIVEVYRMIARASLAASSVLITGESGTGKALVARAIHENGSRKSKTFRKLTDHDDFATFESELESLASGTVVLEDLANLSPADQSKLLRGMETAESNGWDIRWIGISRVSPPELVRSGVLREDLLDRLNVLTIEIPPLRSRIEDLPDLVGTFLARYSEKNRKAVSHIAESAMQRLREYAWPGNIRELERLIEKAVAMSAGRVLELEDFPEIVAAASVQGSETRRGESARGDPAASLEEVERAHILRVLAETGFNKSKASEILGIDRATLYRKAKSYGITLKPAGANG